jgi:hypothetical protein
MNNQQFFEKVAQMRQHQKTFFQARPSSQERKDALIASKRLETEASSLVEGFDMETQYRQGYIVANITKRTVTYNGKDWEAMTLKPGSSMPTTMQAKGGAA